MKSFTALSLALFVLSAAYVATCEAYRLPDTGQSQCYDSDGNIVICPASGQPLAQDGSYNSNPLSYTDNADGTVTDNNTGLLWQKQTDDVARRWDEAGSYCASSTLAGHSDWRLPTKEELIGIVDYGTASEASYGAYFPGSESSSFWSSTVYWDSLDSAWSVSFNDDVVSNHPGADDYLVRCVRGAPDPGNFFTDNGDDTVTDHATDLIWQKGEGGTMSWAAALEYCEGLSLADHSDWRLPNDKELESVSDGAKGDPAIDTVFFPGARPVGYWSSTSVSDGAHYAWFVDFYDGYVDYNYKSYDEYSVRCVRAEQSGLSANNCAAVLSNDLSLYVPAINVDNKAYYWAVFSYVMNTQDFTLTNAGVVVDTSPFNSCSASTLSAAFKLHIPAVIVGTDSYWADLEYVHDLIFRLTGAGQN